VPSPNQSTPEYAKNTFGAGDLPQTVCPHGERPEKGIRLTPHPVLFLEPHTEGMRPILQ